MKRLLGLMLIAAVVASGCGKSDSKDSAKTTTTKAPTTTTTTIPSADQDKAKAQTIILTQADAGAGFTKSTDDKSKQPDPTDQAIDKCANGNALLASDGHPRGADETYDKGELTSVESSADFGTSEADAKGALDLVSNDTYMNCILDAIKTTLPGAIGQPGVTVSNAQSFRKPVPTTVQADQSTAIEIAITLKVQKQTVPIFIDLVAMRKSRLVVALFITNAPTPYSQSEVARLSGVLSGRLAAA